MTRSVVGALALLVGIGVDPAAAQASHRASDPVGCYRADRPLGTSVGSARFRGVPGFRGRAIGEDSASLPRLMSFRLEPSGRVARPEATRPAPWADFSRWVVRDDSLRVRLSTMGAGWALALAPAAGDDSLYVGTARYLTDVVVKDSSWRPIELPVRVRREACAGSAERGAPGEAEGG